MHNQHPVKQYIDVLKQTYCAQEKALSNAFNDPATKGLGGFGSLAIHHPTGILTALSPF